MYTRLKTVGKPAVVEHELVEQWRKLGREKSKDTGVVER